MFGRRSFGLPLCGQSQGSPTRLKEVLSGQTIFYPDLGHSSCPVIPFRTSVRLRRCGVLVNEKACILAANIMAKPQYQGISMTLLGNQAALRSTE